VGHGPQQEAIVTLIRQRKERKESLGFCSEVAVMAKIVIG